MKGFVLLAVFCVTAPRPLTAMDPPPDRITFRHISTEQGLSQSIVYDILKDRRGFMWVATGYGLNFYDGYQIRTYNNDPYDSTTIGSNKVRCLFEDSRGVLWAGTWDGGLNRFNRTDETFTRVAFEGIAGESDLLRYINAVGEDHRGNLWVGTQHGLVRYEPSTGKSILFLNNPGDNTSISDNEIQCIFRDNRQNIWIGTWNGLNLYKDDGEGFIRFKNEEGTDSTISDNTVLSIFQNRSGELWIGTRKGGLNRYDYHTGRFVHYMHDPGNGHSLNNNTVLTITEDHPGNLWIGTWNGGINVFDPGSGRFTHFRYNTADPSSLSHDQVWSSYTDETGTLWFGTHGGGLNIYQPFQKKFEHHYHRSEDTASLSNNMVISIFQDSRDILWIGTYQGGLNRYDPGSGEFAHYYRDTGSRSGLPSDRVGPIVEDIQGVLWIGTQLTDDAGGLCSFDPVSGVFKRFRNDPADPRTLSHDEIWAMCYDGAEYLWIGTNGGGLDRFNIRTHEFTHFRHKPDDPGSLSNDRVTCILEDHDGKLWIATREGANLLDPASGSSVRFAMDPADPNSLSHNLVNTLYLTRDNQLWIGTRYGLNRYDRQSRSFIHYYEEDGLPDSNIKGIVEDRRGFLWISTNGGISRFDPAGEGFINYSFQDGLQSNEFNDNACFINREGKIFFGGVNGFNAFYPDSIHNNPHIPPLFITGFRLFNKTVEPGTKESPLKRSIIETDLIQLKYNQNHFSLDYVALNFIHTEKSLYKYMLENFDSDWVMAGNRRSAHYTNVPPGKYIFRVTGSNNDNQWNGEGAMMTIHISPPVWQRWWFRGMIGVFTMSLLVLAHMARTRIMRERQKMLESQVAERTAEVLQKSILLEEKNRELELQKEEIRLQADAINQINNFLKKRNLKLTEDVRTITDARIMQKRVSFEEFTRKYPDDEACLKYLDELKWKEGYRCRKCGHDGFTYTNLSLHNIPFSRRCRKCKTIESPTVGTLFYRLKFPIVKAFYILFLVSGGKEMTVDELSKILKLRRQTCWSFQKKVKAKIEASRYQIKHADGWSHLVLMSVKRKKQFVG